MKKKIRPRFGSLIFMSTLALRDNIIIVVLSDDKGKLEKTKSQRS